MGLGGAMAKIKEIYGREIYDSRGEPTVECDLILDDGSIGRGSVPSGASIGKFEAHEKRDGRQRLGGKGTREAVRIIETEIRKELIGKENKQEEIDNLLCELDGTKNKKRLGANSILAVSIALLKASASNLNVPLHLLIEEISRTKHDHYDFPYPFINVINGGKHADNNLDFQEFMIVPMAARSFAQALEMSGEVFLALKKVLKENKLSVSVGDEGGFAPDLRNNEEAISYLMKAINNAGFKPGHEIFIALDVAANSFYESEEKLYNFKSQYKKRDRDKMIKHFAELTSKYPIISIEDPLSEDDYEGWVEITKLLGAKIEIVGDDFFVTNAEKIEQGAREGMGNAVIIKPNQAGSVTETFKATHVAQDNGFTCMIAHRSGETEDTWIADLAYGTKAKQIKSGSFSRGERMAKYNQLVRIEEDRKNNRILSSFKNLTLEK